MSITSGKEFTKTLLFVGTAVLTMFIAVRSRPQLETTEKVGSEEVGLPMFADLTDTSKVTGLEVLSFNDELGSLRPFKIEQERDGEWVIPSRQRYPADAQDRVARAATMFVDLKVLQVREGDHERFGVVEPKFGVTKIGDEGVGTLFKVMGKSADKANTPLAELIIGKPVKDLAGQHYVRRPGKSLVYQVEIDPSGLSTEFTSWIDRTLLPFSGPDVASLGLHNYTTGIEQSPEGPTVSFSGNYEADLVPADNGEWKLDKFREYQSDGSLVNSKLDSEEILNQNQIAELGNALDQIVISNVQRKPEELGNKLRAGELELTTSESSNSLLARGFYPVKQGDEPGQLFATQGEIKINLASGIQFRLLLGQLAQQANGAATEGTTLDRFLLILPELNQADFPEPQLEPLPSEDEEMSENDRKNAVERIEKSNKRVEDEYNEQLKNAQDVVQILRDRYADWYYLVQEDAIRKLRIPRSKLIKLSEQALQEGFGIEAFRKLQADGLKQ